MDAQLLVINSGWLAKSPPEFSRTIFKHIKRPKRFLPKWRRRYFELTLSEQSRCLAYYRASSGDRRGRPKGIIELAQILSVAARDRPPSNAMATLPAELIPSRPRRCTVGNGEASTDSTADYSDEADWLQRCAFSILVSIGDRNSTNGRNSQRRYYFLAESPIVASHWVECIGQACGLPKLPGTGPAVQPPPPTIPHLQAHQHPLSNRTMPDPADDDYVYLSTTTTSAFSGHFIQASVAENSSTPAPAAAMNSKGYINLTSDSSTQSNSLTTNQSARVIGQQNNLVLEQDDFADCLPLPRRRQESKSSSSTSTASTGDAIVVPEENGLANCTNYAQLDIGEMQHASAEAANQAVTNATKPAVAIGTVEYSAVDAMRTLALAEMTSS